MQCALDAFRTPYHRFGFSSHLSHERIHSFWRGKHHQNSPFCQRLMLFTRLPQLLISYEAYQNALGIRSLGLSYPSFGLNSVVSSPAMIALGSFDGKTRILSRNSLQLCFVLTSGHPRDMDSAINTRNVVTSVEVPSHDSYNPAAIDGDVTSRRMPLSDLSTNQPDRIFLSTGRLSDTKTSPADSTHYAKRMMKTLPRCAIASKTSSYPVMGVHWLQWSPDGDYLATRDESYPRCLWIWKPLEAKLVALLVQLDNISSVSWQPQRTREGSVQESRLALCTSSSKVYTWTPSFGAEIHQPLSTALALKRSNNEDDVTHTAITSLEWSADGKCILLRGKESFTVCRVE